MSQRSRLRQGWKTCFCALLIPAIFFAFFSWYVRNKGPASRSYYMLQDEAKMILANVQGDGGVDEGTVGGANVLHGAVQYEGESG